MSEENLDPSVHEVLSGLDNRVLPAELKEENKPEGASKSLYVQIQTMTVSEKTKLALRGNKGARTLLLRDPSRTIRRYVLQNPRITNEEIVALVRNRGTEDELLRVVAGNRDWIKYYQVKLVKLGLVENPHTPLAVAMHLLPLLQKRETRNLARSKNVPTVISTQAKRLMLQKDSRRS
jgi:hypothetical protein